MKIEVTIKKYILPMTAFVKELLMIRWASGERLTDYPFVKAVDVLRFYPMLFLQII